MVPKQRNPSRIEAQGGARSVRRDAVEIAASELLNRRHMQDIEGIEGKAIARHRRQSHSCWDGPASTMEKPCGARWGMVPKQRNPSRIEAQGGARSVRRDAVEIASSELLNKRHMQGIEGIEGKAIAVGMDRPVPC